MNKLLFVFLSIILMSLLTGCGTDQKETDSKLQAKTQASAQAPAQTKPQSNAAETQKRTMVFDAPDPDGNIHSSTEWIGKGPVVVNFWGTWCPPCRREIPDLVRLYKEYKDKGVEILGMAVNDTPHKVKAYSEKNNMDWILLIADRAIAVKYNIRSVPMTIFFDKDGYIVAQYQGLKNYEDLKKGFDLIS